MPNWIHFNFFQGDRPMTTKGYGPPLDALDAVCKAYKALGLIKLTIRIIFSSEFSDVNFKSFKAFSQPFSRLR